ncbi:hypothetical protein I7G00_12840 [Sinorhizobium meliloti]|uniref:hypothetical protein n=1 Tax=Rhizobium meliloti TaxID=382 RepID=UPI000FD559F1|nr:hypothetical protein [Sinorhizobium meliloti]MDE3784931.1 hypothetical protein [Sinorhizobium meliloti]RVI01600.1 hypothetical protein CN206_28985 [Sinorhizobium meliloti]UIJ95981.1 hypothetical protein LZK74_21625 [Sinorhizobium meliloti]WKL27023.1 hypothetical protein Q1M63_23030 [Sinorhizobium meliloti]WKL32406.1 hypothetical protein Q1M65_20745 [Sinorhizobium meliloti]
MTFLEAYAKFGPDTLAIAEALHIKENEADRLINARLNCSYAERLHARRVKKIAYAGKEPFTSEWAR